MSELWFFLHSPPATAAYNMALDEALLRTAAQRARPLLRVYSWEKPSASVGYFQKFPAHLADRYDIVRRPTSGGLVYHVADTTYTAVIPPRHGFYEMKTADAYCALHKAVAAALQLHDRLCDVPAESPRGSYECFETPVAGDVVADGKKLAGAAQRRTKWGMLHQGSIAARVGADQLLAGFTDEFGASFDPYEIPADVTALAEELARSKYATDAWNQRVQ
jgi:lipoate-protein ligase A